MSDYEDRKTELRGRTKAYASATDESMLWLELLRDDCDIRFDGLNWLLKESDELIAIFVTMSKKVKRRLEGEK